MSYLTYWTFGWAAHSPQSWDVDGILIDWIGETFFREPRAWKTQAGVVVKQGTERTRNRHTHTGTHTHPGSEMMGNLSLHTSQVSNWFELDERSLSLPNHPSKNAQAPGIPSPPVKCPIRREQRHDSILGFKHGFGFYYSNSETDATITACVAQTMPGHSLSHSSPLQRLPGQYLLNLVTQCANGIQAETKQFVNPGIKSLCRVQLPELIKASCFLEIFGNVPNNTTVQEHMDEGVGWGEYFSSGNLSKSTTSLMYFIYKVFTCQVFKWGRKKSIQSFNHLKAWIKTNIYYKSIQSIYNWIKLMLD